MEPINSIPKRRGRITKMRHRRYMGFTLLILAVVILIALVNMQEAGLRNSSWSTGYLLGGCLFFLAAWHWRKKLSFLPRTGGSRMWMQLHIYVALFSIAVFVAHTGFRIPNGAFEQLLAGLYLLVSGSGVYGLYATRTVPKKLTAVENEVIFEQIPQRKKEIVRQARQLVLSSAQSTDVLARFYVNQLIYFFEKPRSVAYQVAPTMRRSKQLVSEIEGLDRYLSRSQRGASQRLCSLVKEKDNLDYHWALQGKLKVWQFVHIGFTYSLLIVSVLHGVMAHSFGGGLR